jgi:hypothetical protein
MTAPDLQNIADTVVRRAQRQGYVVPREVRAALAQAGLPEARWKDVLALTRESLHYRQGRYYYLDTVSPALRAQQSQQQMVANAVRKLIRQHKATTADRERREADRVDFVHQVRAVTEDGRELHLLTRDLSPTGIRLLSTRSLLGQKLGLSLSAAGRAPGPRFAVRILWTCAVGDDLFENGGNFLELLPEPPPLRIAGDSEEE